MALRLGASYEKLFLFLFLLLISYSILPINVFSNGKHYRKIKDIVPQQLINDGSFPPPSDPPDGKLEKYAVCIGVTEYAGSSLSFSDDDALSWRDYLEEHGYEVIYLIGYVTSYDVDMTLRTLLSKEDGDDWVAIIYAGHGYYDVDSGVSAIVLSDNVCLTEEYFDDFDDSLDSDHVFYFFDACYMGGMRILGDKTTRYVALASDEYHLAYEDPELGHGVFTHYFLIDGIIRRGYVYMEDAFNNAFYWCTTSQWSMYPVEADGNPSTYFTLYEISGGEHGYPEIDALAFGELND